MFIVTYTAEHNHPAPTHRNPLAGSTCQKSSDHPTTKSPMTTISTYSSSSVTSSNEFVLTVEDLAVGDLNGDEDLLSLSDTVVSEDFSRGGRILPPVTNFSGILRGKF
ncbi:unnamed protein product [Eruca vesicaria subsp. sativa]|uniref:WRKY domain-containing protein n=1 Tax=Eruca vesicaria subsp. sativa TaxID=29727 RepID=A0ABC8JHD0_ERUVS|nr:unnamed protein product [Eruca vesicaria subsp. sativa]